MFNDQSHQATKELAELDDAYMDSHWNLLQYFGHIKVLSTDTKAKRFERFAEEMEKIGNDDYEVVLGPQGETLDPALWSRMVNWDRQLSADDLKKRHQGQTGCYMAHYMAIKGTVDAYKNAQKELANLTPEEQSAKIKRLSSVLIIEDNNGFGRVTGPHSATLQGMGRQFRLAMQDLPENWDMFYFMAMLDAKKFTDNLAQLKYGLVTKCYAINASIYDRIIEAFDIQELKPVDHVIASLHATSNSYVATPPLTYRFASKSLVGGDLGRKETAQNWQSHVNLQKSEAF